MLPVPNSRTHAVWTSSSAHIRSPRTILLTVLVPTSSTRATLQLLTRPPTCFHATLPCGISLGSWPDRLPRLFASCLNEPLSRKPKRPRDPSTRAPQPETTGSTSLLAVTTQPRPARRTRSRLAFRSWWIVMHAPSAHRSTEKSPLPCPCFVYAFPRRQLRHTFRMLGLVHGRTYLLTRLPVGPWSMCMMELAPSLPPRCRLHALRPRRHLLACLPLGSTPCARQN